MRDATNVFPAISASVSRREELRRALAAETQKTRHGSARRVAVLFPLPLVALGLAIGVASGKSGPIGYSTCGWNYWYTLMLPVSVSLQCVSVAGLDSRHSLRSVLGLPLDPSLSWWGKVTTCLLLLLTSNAVVLAGSVVVWALGGSAPTPPAGIEAALILTIGFAWMVPASLLLSLRMGTLAGVAIPSLVQIGGGIALWGSDAWWAFVPSAALRLPSAVLGVEPSGIPVAPQSYATYAINGTWWAALALCAVAFVLLSLVGARLARGGGAS